MSKESMWLAAEPAARQLLRNRAVELVRRAITLRAMADELDGAAADMNVALCAIEELLELPAAPPSPGQERNSE